MASIQSKIASAAARAESARRAQALAEIRVKEATLDKAGTAAAVKNLAKATELAGPENAQAITGPIARALALGRMEQKGA